MDEGIIHDVYGRFKRHIEAGLLPDMRVENDEYSPACDVYPNELDHFIAKLLGFSGAHALHDSQDPEVINRLILLAGDNSWAVYKMLLAQKGSSNEEEIPHQL